MTKKIFLVLMLSCISHLLPAQSIREQKTDSVCALVKKYLNEKNSEKLYGLAGESFSNLISDSAFNAFCHHNLFPLGRVREIRLEKYVNDIGRYRVEFDSTTRSLLLGLDENDRIKSLLFIPYANKRKDHKAASDNPLITPLDKKVDSAVQPYMAMAATTGLSIGVLKDGKTFFYGYGETAKGNGQLPDKNTIFEIGSISKTFTAVLLAEAVNNGKVKLSDPVNKYLPDSIPALAYEDVPVTLKTLSNHSSGIPRLPSNFHSTDPGNPYKDYDINDLFSFYKHFKLSRKPGEKYEYSNLAAGTLGVILERIYHKSYEALLIEKICNPLNMEDTRQFIRKKDSARFAKGYNNLGRCNPPWDFKALVGAGGIRSTATDLIRYAKANMGQAPPALSKAIQLTHKVTFNKGVKVGLAWHFIKPGNDEVLFHNGETGGYRSYLAINPEKKFAVVILSNTSVALEKAGNALMKWLEEN